MECSDVLCPELTCSRPIVLEGECCPACEENNQASAASASAGNKVTPVGRCYFAGDGKYHTAGTKWHPYIPPFGFSRCATCTCRVSQG